MPQDEFEGFDFPDINDFEGVNLPDVDEFVGIDFPETDEFEGLDLPDIEPTPKVIEEPRGAVEAFGKGIIAGVRRRVPEMVGQAIEFTGVAPETGRKIKEFAREGELRPEFKGEAAKAFGEAGEMIPASVGLTLGLTGLGKAVGLIPHPFAKVAGGALQVAGKYGIPSLFGLAQARSTEEIAEERGIEPGAAPYITGAIETGGETLGTLALTRLLGPLAPLAEAGAVTIKSIVKPTLKRFALEAPKTFAIELSTEFAQQYGQATVEKAYGIREEAEPLSEAVGVLAPTAIMTAFGMGSAKLGRIKSEKDITEALTNPEMDKEKRSAAVVHVSRMLEDSTTPELAEMWAVGALESIDNNEAISIDEEISPVSASATSHGIVKSLTEDMVEGGKITQDQAATIVGRFAELSSPEATQEENANILRSLVAETGVSIEEEEVAPREVVPETAEERIAATTENIKAQVSDTLDAMEPTTEMGAQVKGLIQEEMATADIVKEIEEVLPEAEIIEEAPAVEAELPEEVAPEITPRQKAYSDAALSFGLDTEGKSAEQVEAEVKTAVESPSIPEQEYLSPQDKQADYGRRKQVEELFAKGDIDGATRLIFRDGMTGNLNKLAFMNDAPLAEAEGKVFASLDMSGLKWINDKFGHDAGDALLKIMGDSLNDVAPENSYRIGGDEYSAIFDNEEQARVLLDKVKADLAERELRVTSTDGAKRTFKGWSFDYDTAGTYTEADRKLVAYRKRAEAAGHRRRGDIPVGLAEVGAKRVEDRVPAKKEEVTPKKVPTKAEVKPGKVLWDDTLESVRSGLEAQFEAKPQLITDWIKAKGGISTKEHLAGEMKRIASIKEAGVNLMVSPEKGGQSLDNLLGMSIDEGLLPQDSSLNDFQGLMETDIGLLKAGWKDKELDLKVLNKVKRGKGLGRSERRVFDRIVEEQIPTEPKAVVTEDILSPDGTPFKTQDAAFDAVVEGALYNAEIVPTEGGFVIRAEAAEVAPKPAVKEKLELAPTEKPKAPPKKEEQIDLLKVQPKFPEAKLKGKEAKRVELIDVPKEIAAEKAQVKIEEAVKPKRAPRPADKIVMPSAVKKEEAEAKPKVTKEPTPEFSDFKSGRVKLGASPQGWKVLSEVTTKEEEAAGERYFEIENEKTGEKQIVTFEEMKPIKAKKKVDIPFKRREEAPKVGELFRPTKRKIELSADNINSLVEIIISKWKNAPKIVAVNNVNNLPNRLHDAVMLAKGEKDIEGIFDPETQGVYLIAGNIESTDRALDVLFHESLGHFGIRGLLGKDITPVLNQVYTKYRPEAQRIAKKYDFDVKTATGRRQAAEEVLADIAQKNSDVGILKKAFAAIRNWLRKMGFNIKLSDNDIRSMMADAAQFVKADKKSLSLSGPPVFAKKPATPTVKMADLRKAFEKDITEPTLKDTLDLTAEEKKLPKKKFGDHRDYSGSQKEALSKIGVKPESKSLTTKLLDMKENLGTKIRQKLVDQYASLKGLSEQGHILAVMSNTSTGALEAAFKHGKLRLDEDGAITVDETGNGLAKILSPLGEELDDFLGWIAGNRAKNLKGQDRERLFSDEDIESLISLSEGTMDDGARRKPIYNKVLRDINAFQKSMLDIAVKTGTINEEERASWNADFYVPFYRVLEEAEGVKGPRTLDALAGQTAVKKLKGADVPLNDILQNILMNWNHLLNASLKNQAAVVNLDAAVDMGAAEQVKEKDKTKNSVFVRKDGKKVWYDVNEPLILESISALSHEGFNSRGMKAMRAFKRAFTIGVTASPEFRIANLLRDSIHSVAVGKMKYNVLDNVFGKGWTGTKKDSLIRAKMLAGGGEIHFGHNYGTDPEAAKLLIEKGIKKDTILDNPKAFGHFTSAFNTAWDSWNEVGSRLENINRAALYQNRVKEIGHLRASFEARDLMNFTNSGAASSIRFLTQVVPFLNARMQGLDKMARSFADKDQRAQFINTTGAVMLASVALYLAFKDDDDFKDREEWDRDTYWWFKLPGSDTAYRIPKPFEVGALGTMAERMAEQIADDEAHGELFAERLQHMIAETFSFSVVPQMVQPTLDIYSNKNPFTKRPIETLSMERLSPTERKKAWTSETAIGLSKAMDKISWGKVVLSPVQIEHLVKGYLGWMGATGLQIVDNLFARQIGRFPTEPSRRIEDYPAIGRFIRKGPQRNTKYATMFYTQMEEINQAYNDVLNYQKIGEYEKARELRKEKRGQLRLRKYFNGVQRRLNIINRRVKRVYADKEMTADQKRDEIDLLTSRKNRLLKIAAKRSNVLDKK